MKSPSCDGAYALGHGDECDRGDGGARWMRLERHAQAAEQRLRVARRRRQVERAVVAAAVVEAERETESGAADAVETEPRHDPLHQRAQHEEQRLERVERPLERHGLLDVAGR